MEIRLMAGFDSTRGVFQSLVPLYERSFLVS